MYMVLLLLCVPRQKMAPKSALKKIGLKSPTWYPSPMLAKEYGERFQKKGSAKLFSVPLIMQPKLDGVRMLAWIDTSESETASRPVIRLTSRTGKPFDHLLVDFEEELHSVFEAAQAAASAAGTTHKLIALDGELYAHGLGFQKIVSMVKNGSVAASTRASLQYVVYDGIFAEVATASTASTGYEDRMAMLRGLLGGSRRRIKWLEAHDKRATSEKVVEKTLDEYILLGYEGVMLRDPNSPYQLDARSDGLLKYKRFFDAEYRIVGFKEASGKDAGTVLWECEVPSPKAQASKGQAPNAKTPSAQTQTRPKGQFTVRPTGTLEERREWLQRAKAGGIVGHAWLTVRYQELTDDGVPRFPVGITIRDYE